MKSRYGLFYFFAFIIAAALRFIQLGALPLTDKEAAWALEALAVAQGKHPLLSGNPGYVLLTSIPFYLFESSNFWARFVPAFSGSMIVFLPYFLRKDIGERVALLYAFLLAFAPGLIAVSRQAKGTTLAVTFGFFALLLWQKNKPRLAGVFAGIALLGGSSAWMGLVSLGATYLAAKKFLPTLRLDEQESSSIHVRLEQKKRKSAAIFGGGTILIIGTRFFLSPNGLNAWLTSLVNYLSGWTTASGVSVGQIFEGLLVYYPLALFFAAIAKWRALKTKERKTLLLSMWAVVSFLLVLVYPARQVSDLIWVALPLWLLSAKEIVHYLHPPEVDQNETLGVFALTILLLVFAWLNLASAGSLPENIQLTAQHQWLLGGSILLLIVSLVLIAFGWSVDVAVLGGAWGLLLGLGIYTFGAAWGATGLRTPKGVELWDSTPRTAQNELLHQSIAEISTWSRGDANSLEITISGVHSPALLWELREYTVNEAFALNMTTAPELVITPATDKIDLASAYRGQEFTWRQTPDWQRTHRWSKWVILREVPLNSEKIILWVRNDLFFDSQNQ